MSRPPLRPVRFAPPDTTATPTADGGCVLRSRTPLEGIAPRVGDWVDRWARDAPERAFLTEPGEGGRRVLTYGDARRRVREVAGGLLARGLGPDRPVVILSGNGIDHAILALAAMYVGVPVVPVSAAWTLMSSDGARVASVLEQVRPGLVFASDAERFATGLQHADPDVVVTDPGDLAGAADVDAAAAAVGPETIAKILFTSGSTGAPKGVLNPHRMLTANQAMIRSVWPFVDDEPPVLVDWLPWNHTFGGNHNFNLALSRGGTLHIDVGRPVPGLLDATLSALREHSPTVYFNVPAGFAALLPHLEADADLAASFFAELKVLFYAGASLPPDLWHRLEALAVRTTGERVAMSSGWGSTETAPAATTVHADIDRAGVIGWPAPGSEIRMVPLPGEDRFELRVRGPHVTPGYHGRPDLTAAAFDDEGFYKIGDAGRLAVPGDPLSGLVFDGRVAEDFKLLSGTWVRAGRLRPAALAACDGLLNDAIVTGHDRADVGLLGWANETVAAARGLSGDALQAAVRERLDAWGEGRGSSERVARFALLTTPPDADAGEITDKGYINQRRARELRAADVEALYEGPADAGPSLGERARSLKEAMLRHAGLVGFFGGFLYDSITLRRIDKVFDNVLLAVYLTILGVLLVLERRAAWHRSVPRFVTEYPRALELATQFLFGGLFSAYVVFYFKSAGGAGSLLFMLLLAAAMVLNEFGDGALRRLETIRLALYFFTSFSFFLFAIPVFAGVMNPFMWVPAAAAAAVPCLLVVIATHAGRGGLPSFLGGTTLKERLLFLGGMMATMTVGLAILAGSGLIPPVPLSVMDRVVAHDIDRQEDGYHLKVDRGAWVRALTLRPPRVRWAEGEGVVVFTAVFAPKGTKLDLAHRWQLHENDEWVDTEPKPIRVSVMGGRRGGFRTYTRKRRVGPGAWRVLVETEDERVLGTVRFDVRQVDPERIKLREIVR